MLRWALPALSAVVLLLNAAVASAQLDSNSAEINPEVRAALDMRSDLGAMAPELYGLDISGVPVSLDSMRGKWVYVDFWATWCGPCMKELPNVVKVSRDMEERDDFSVIGVSLDTEQTYGNLKKTVSKARIGYPIIYDADGGTDNIANAWGVQLIPSTFLIDPQGRIAARDLSPGSVKQFISLSQQQSGTSQPAGGKNSKPSKNGKVSKAKDSKAADTKTKGGKGKDTKAADGKSAKATDGKAAKTSAKTSKPPVDPVPFAPLSIRSMELLRGDSPSTGRGDMRDLEIRFSMPKGSRQISRYQVFVSAAAATQDSPASRFNWLYDIAVSPNEGNSRQPYKVSIRESSGKGYSEVVSMDPSVASPGMDAATAVSGKLLNQKSPESLRNPSDILVALDEEQREYQIIVPVPVSTSQLRYAIAVYDEQLKEYIRNGLVQVSIE